MRIAVLADVHANAPALRAVLRELDDHPAEAIVMAGDVVSGPLNLEVLNLLSRRAEPVHWLRGNCEDNALGADGTEGPTDVAAWTAAALDERWRRELRSWPTSLELGGIRVCHGTPRDANEIITRGTPDGVLAQALAGTREPLVVGGHTHQQTVRRVSDGLTYVNAGSVGLPYEARDGAYWLIVDGATPELRRTPYDLEAALVELRAPGFAGLEEMIEGSLVDPVDPGWVTAFFEHAAGRGDHPGDPPAPRP